MNSPAIDDRADRLLVIYSGGYNHPFEESSGALAAIAARSGFSCEITGDLAAATASAAGGVLAMNALQWSMTQHERYAPDRAAWAGQIADEDMAAIEAHVAAGGGLLACHTAVICWDLQPRWPKLLGGGWDWDRSFHPPFGEIAVSLTAAGSALSNGAREFSLRDEAYHNLDPAADCEVLATAEAGHGPQPVAWRRMRGPGRVAVNALGHDAGSLEEPGHAALISGLLQWLADPRA